jgi:hypothetical protein
MLSNCSPQLGFGACRVTRRLTPLDCRQSSSIADGAGIACMRPGWAIEVQHARDEIADGDA